MDKEYALQKVTEVEQRLQKSPIGRAIVDGVVSLVPVFGAAVSSVLSSRAAELAEKNTERLIECIRVEIHQLGEQALKREFLESEEFAALLLRMLEFNARSYRQEKSILFARVFTQFLVGNGPDVPFKDGFVRLIDELDPEHMMALSIIYRLSRESRSDTDAENHIPPVLAEQIAEELEPSNGRALAYCEQMLRYGLLRDWGIGRFNYMPGSFEITDYGREFCAFLGDMGSVQPV